MNSILVSIIIPVYNTAKYIARCLDSVCSQSYKNLEIIVIDDCSQDGVDTIIKLYAEKDHRIIFSRNTVNLGNGKSRNNAINMAKGEYLLFVDSDDYIQSDMVEKLVAKAKNKPDVVVFGYRCWMENLSFEQNNKIKPELPTLNGKETKDELFLCHMLILKNIGSQPWLYFCKTDFLISNKIYFDESGYHFEDVIFTTKLMFYVNRIEQISEPLYVYCIRKGSITQSWTKKTIESRIYSCQCVKEFLKEQNVYEKFKSAYVICFVRGTFLIPFQDFTRMTSETDEVEQFLYNLSKTDLIRNFCNYEFSLPQINGVKKEDLEMENMKKFVGFLSYHFKCAKYLMRLSVKINRLLGREPC